MTTLALDGSSLLTRYCRLSYELMSSHIHIAKLQICGTPSPSGRCSTAAAACGGQSAGPVSSWSKASDTDLSGRRRKNRPDQQATATAEATNGTRKRRTGQPGIATNGTRKLQVLGAIGNLAKWPSRMMHSPGLTRPRHDS